MTEIMRRAVRFEAEQERTGSLPVGLANVLRAIGIADDPAQLNLTSVIDVPPGVDLDRVLDAVRELLTRHESLRTTYPAGPGGALVQHVHATGALDVELHEAAADEDAAALAVLIGRRLRAGAFDLAGELPLRVAVVSRSGSPVHVAVVLCHSAADATTWELLLREWHTLLAGNPLGSNHDPQPIDLVAIEQRRSVQRLMAGALRYWDTQLRAVPQAMFTAPGMEEGRQVWPGLRVRSTAAADAVARIEARTGAGGSAVVLAVMALLVARRAGLPQCQVTALAKNRVLPELREFVGTIAQDALVPIHLGDGDGTFDELLRHVRTAAMRAYRNSWFDPTDLWEVITAVGEDRGVSWARDCVFNDMSALVRGERAPHELAPGGRYPALRTDSAHLRADLVDDELGAEFIRLPEEWMGTPFVLYVHQLEGTVDLSVWAAPAALAEPEVLEFARSLLRIVARAADGDAPLAELAALSTLGAAERGPEWVLADSCWVEPAAVRRLLDQVLAGAPYHLVTEPDDALGHRLVLHTAGDADPRRLHAACLAALPGRPGAMAPHHYVVHAAAPAQAGDLAAWLRQPVVAEGGGRPERPVADVAELAAAAREPR